jgi:lysozyme
MIINDKGRKIIEDYEGCRLEAYLCPAGRWSIGYGHTGDVKPGDKVTQHQAEVILEYDLHRVEKAVGDLAPKANANQFSSLVSFAYNVGTDALRTSKLLKRFLAGGPLAAAAEFDKWTHVDGNVLPGLVRRRAAEKALFLEVPS